MESHDNFDTQLWSDRNARITDGRGHWIFNACVNQNEDPDQARWSGYQDAANILVQHVLANQRTQDTLVYPILFLYRHCVELQLKFLAQCACSYLDEQVPNLFGHDLTRLWSVVRPIFERFDVERNEESNLNADDYNVAEFRIQQIAELDNSTATVFRYGFGNKGERLLREDITLININDVGVILSELTEFFECMDCGLQVALDEKSDWLGMQTEYESEMEEHYF